MEKLKQILGVAVLNGKFIQRQPLWIFQGFIMVLGLAITLFAWGSEAALRNLVIAYFVTGAWSLGLNIVAQIIGWDRVHLFYETYVASPITLPVYFIGAVLASLPFFLVNVAPAIVLALLLQMDVSFLTPTLFLSAVSIVIGAFTSLSVILRLKKSHKHLSHNESTKHADNNITSRLLPASIDTPHVERTRPNSANSFSYGARSLVRSDTRGV